MDLLTPKSPNTVHHCYTHTEAVHHQGFSWGLPSPCLTSAPWGNVAKPVVSPLTPVPPARGRIWLMSEQKAKWRRNHAISARCPLRIGTTMQRFICAQKYHNICPCFFIIFLCACTETTVFRPTQSLLSPYSPQQQRYYTNILKFGRFVSAQTAADYCARFLNAGWMTLKYFDVSKTEKYR